MKVIRIADVPIETRSGGIFTGTIESKALVGEATGAVDLKLDVISFPRGVRNKPHSHSYDQALYILSGKGIVATEKEEVAAEPGMLFFIPRGEKHWHGATKDSEFSHISILRPGEIKY
jgi:quercetin dioxygenase-like cupin family protein